MPIPAPFDEEEQERRLPNTHDWQTMSPGEKQAWLLDKALDCKREILTLPMPDPNDDSAEAMRLRALILAAADSTIEQTIRLRTNLLTPSMNDDDIERVLEERRRRGLAQIAAMEAEESGGEPFKPN
jgi:hypothetical protein